MDGYTHGLEMSLAVAKALAVAATPFHLHSAPRHLQMRAEQKSKEDFSQFLWILEAFVHVVAVASIMPAWGGMQTQVPFSLVYVVFAWIFTCLPLQTAKLHKDRIKSWV